MDHMILSYDLGKGDSAWILDLYGRLWYMRGVTPTRPEGDGIWWQVGLILHHSLTSSHNCCIFIDTLYHQ